MQVFFLKGSASAFLSQGISKCHSEYMRNVNTFSSGLEEQKLLFNKSTKDYGWRSWGCNCTQLPVSNPCWKRIYFWVYIELHNLMHGYSEVSAIVLNRTKPCVVGLQPLSDLFHTCCLVYFAHIIFCTHMHIQAESCKSPAARICITHLFWTYPEAGKFVRIPSPALSPPYIHTNIT